MNLDALYRAEAQFLNRYPGGFTHPDMVAIGKKHKMEQMIRLCQEGFTERCFSGEDAILQHWIKIVSRSSMVSVFEKPQFKAFIQSLSAREKTQLTESLYDQLYGDQQNGFDIERDLLVTHKMAKWPIISVVPAYFSPTNDVFIKPTTAKGVVAKFGLESLVYKPRPSWSFYSGYRQAINDMKGLVDPTLSPSNAAFSGFLMMSL